MNFKVKMARGKGTIAPKQLQRNYYQRLVGAWSDGRLLPPSSSLLYPTVVLKATMHILKSALTAALSLGSLARTTTAFSTVSRSSIVASHVGRVASSSNNSGRTFTATTTALNANVLKLTEPAKDLLPGVDVFIFDCDGVIWRVSFDIYGAVRCTVLDQAQKKTVMSRY